MADSGSIDIADLISEGLSNVKSGLSDVMSTVSSTLASGQATQKVQATAAQQEKQGTDIVSAAQAAADEKLKADNAASQAMIGNLPGGASRLLQLVGSTVLDKQEQLQSLQDQVEKAKGTSFFDSPLDWLTNQFTLPFREARLDQTQKDINQRLGVVSAVQEATTAAAKDNASVDVIDARTKETGLNLVSAAAANKALADSQAQLERLGLTGAQLTQANTVEQFSTTLGAINAQAGQSRLDIERMQLDVTKSYRDMQESRIALEDKIRSDNDADKKDFETALRPAAASIGLDITSVYQFDHASSKMKDVLLTIMSTQASAGGDPFQKPISVTPGAALNLLDQAGTLGGSPGMALVVNKLNDYKAGAMLSADGKTPNPLYQSGKPETRLALEDEAIKQHVQLESSNIPSTGGIYSPVPLMSVTKLPLLAKLPLVQEMAPLAKNAQYATNPDDFITVALKRIKENKETPESAAAQIAATFQGVAGLNNTTRQYSRLAISPLDTNNYPMTVHSVNGRSRVLNMANPAQLKNYLMREQINQADQQILQDLRTR